MAGPWVIGLIVAQEWVKAVFLASAAISVVTGLVCLRWAPETSRRVLEELSP